MTSTRERGRIVVGGAVVVLAVLVLASCAAGPGLPHTENAASLAGFWQGLWHGLICPVTFVVSLFDDQVGIYEIHNDGHWYDFGFVLGLSVIFGGSHGGNAARHRHRR